MVCLIMCILTIIPSDFDGIICSERVFQKVLGRIPMQIVTVWFYQEFTIRPDQAPAMKQEFVLLFSARSRWFWWYWLKMMSFVLLLRGSLLRQPANSRNYEANHD